MTSQVDLAYIIGYVAHGAKGQTRADGVTAYWVHPMRVKELIDEWVGKGFIHPTVREHETMRAAAYLHDVLEDTKINRHDLISLGISHEVLDVVDRLTKPHNGPSPPSYYQGIAEHDLAIIVKCADRASNLESALEDVVPGARNQRWKNYVAKTYTDVLPMYTTMPKLRNELEVRLKAIENAL